MCQLGLMDLDVSNNLLEGEIPQCFQGIPLLFFMLSNNNLSGLFPKFFRNNSDLVILDIARNTFSGLLPTWIGGMTAYQCECSHVMWGLGKGHGCYLAALPLILGQLTKVIRPLKVNE